jgi:hypothetical protein
MLEETGGPGEDYRPVASHWQTLSHTVVHLALIENRTHNNSGSGVNHHQTNKQTNKQTNRIFQFIITILILIASPNTTQISLVLYSIFCKIPFIHVSPIRNTSFKDYVWLITAMFSWCIWTTHQYRYWIQH